MKEALKTLKELNEIQSREGTIDQGDYMIGLYNGIELSIAVIEGREPIYKKCDAPVIE